MFMRFVLPLILLAYSVSATGQAVGAAKSYDFENAALKIHLTPRTPEQMAAFYEGRGFPPAMIALLQQQCFITVGIRNKSTDILWLDLDHWQFTSAQGEVRRYARTHWQGLWKQLEIPAPSQATFRWTLLPETLDFRPDEAEGGNIILERVSQPFTLAASFATGNDRSKTMIRVEIDNVRCAYD